MMKLASKAVSAALVVAASLSGGCATLSESLPSMTNAKTPEQTTQPSVEAELARGRSFEDVGEWDKAAKVYEELSERAPDHWQVAHRLGVVADNQKRFALAQERYSRAIQLNPRNGELFSDLGFCFYLQGKLKKAESSLAKAVHIDPDNQRFHNNLGMVFGQQGRMDEAFEQFATAGSEADAFYNVAFIYASNNNSEAAVECFQMALEVDPTHAKARNAIQSFARDERGESVDPTSGHMVRYDEHAHSGVAKAGFQTSLPDNRHAGAATRQLRKQSQGHMNNVQTATNTGQALTQ